jgi:mannosyl-oligosaccharide alpha-1,2-mannosidase
MKTGISPEYVEFVAGEDFRIGSIAPHYLLRPEAVESFYILNALTGDPVYREWVRTMICFVTLQCMV